MGILWVWQILYMSHDCLCPGHGNVWINPWGKCDPCLNDISFLLRTSDRMSEPLGLSFSFNLFMSSCAVLLLNVFKSRGTITKYPVQKPFFETQALDFREIHELHKPFWNLGPFGSILTAHLWRKPGSWIMVSTTEISSGTPIVYPMQELCAVKVVFPLSTSCKDFWKLGHVWSDFRNSYWTHAFRTYMKCWRLKRDLGSFATYSMQKPFHELLGVRPVSTPWA